MHLSIYFSFFLLAFYTISTDIFSEDGILLTSGWNDYAQLCHKDKVTRDYFETVTKYIKSGTKIKDVYCGPWSTFVIT
jgi:hypothetical protein